MPDCDVAIVGAGPYGLAAAAHLRRVKGLDVRAFGEPMEFWRCRMPQGMLLRSAWSASSIADPDAALTIDAYKRASGNHLSPPVSLARFVDYGLWFQQAVVPDVDPTPISLIEQQDHGFRLTRRDGSTFTASRVVVAAGLSAFANKPPQFQDIPASFVSHTSEHNHLHRFTGQRVAVIGAGQSALESAALLHELGARVEVLVRRSEVHWLGWKERIQKLGRLSRALFSPDDVGPAGVSWLVATPSLLTSLPRPVQDTLRELSLRPAGARWLCERLASVRITTGKTVVAAAIAGSLLKLYLNDGSVRLVDHALIGTGYRVDIARYSFLAPEITRRVQTINGFPKLAAGFESSVPGLHFLGAPSAWSYGPLMHFVSGTRYAGSTLLQYFQNRNGANHR